VSVLLSVVAYRTLNGALFTDLQSRVKNLTEVGAWTIDVAAMKRLNRPDETHAR